MGEFFTALGPGWRLTAAQRARLAAAVTVALNTGWTPQRLAAITGANTSGVRNQYAVLAARLAPAKLPLPHTQRKSRPPWCGQCDERTRMLGFDSDAPPPARAASLAPQPPAPVPLRRWLAPVPVHLRHRCPAVIECKVTNLAGGHDSRPAE
jgi:hypothetical protein